MNEISLSNDLNVIAAEINSYKQLAGQSIFEIGKRLIHVKENDLAHGEFGDWLKTVKMNHRQANRFMKIVKEIPNSTTLPNLGETALYLVATLPAEEREKKHTLPSGETKMVDDMTVREIQELKNKIAQQEKQIDNLSESLMDAHNKAPQVIKEKIEVVPADYDTLKKDNRHIREELNQAKEREEKAIEDFEGAKKRYKDLLESREETEENSEKYKQLTEAIQAAQSNLTDKQRLISNYQNLSQLLRTSNEFLSKASAIVYQDLSEIISSDGLARQELEFLVERTERFLSDLRKQMNQKTIIEGEIIND